MKASRTSRLPPMSISLAATASPLYRALYTRLLRHGRARVARQGRAGQGGGGAARVSRRHAAAHSGRVALRGRHAWAAGHAGCAQASPVCCWPVLLGLWQAGICGAAGPPPAAYLAPVPSTSGFPSGPCRYATASGSTRECMRRSGRPSSSPLSSTWSEEEGGEEEEAGEWGAEASPPPSLPAAPRLAASRTPGVAAWYAATSCASSGRADSWRSRSSRPLA